MALPGWTLQQVLNQLDSGFHWSGSDISYSFPTTIAGMFTAVSNEGNFTAFNANQQASGVLAITLWNDLIAKTFTQENPGNTYDATDIEMGYGIANIDYAHAWYPSEGSAWFNSTFNSGGNDLINPTIGQHGFSTFVHELGHAIGLDHMGDYNGANSNGPSNFYDSTVYSIMSYYGPSWPDGEGQVAWADWVGADGQLYDPNTPMINDIMAVQAMYGADTTTRTGNTVYGFNSNITGNTAAIYNFDLNEHPVLCIWDSAGIDTLDLSDWSTRSVINLAPGSFSDGNSMTSNISIAYNCNIENAVGGAGNDQITGNTLANVLTGGDGNDEIDGEGGSDTAVFGSLWSAISVSYNAVTGVLTANDGQFGTDTITDVEFFTDSAGVTKSFAELTGTTTPDEIGFSTSTTSITEGDSGTKTLQITVVMGAASATQQSVNWTAAGSGASPAGSLDLSGALSGTVIFAAGQTSATISIGIVGDTLDENNETFTVTLSGPTGGYTLGQSTLVATITDNDGSDVINEIVGNRRSNTLFGTDGVDHIWGRRGNDSLFGFAGDDQLIGGSGRDRLFGGTGNDTLWSGGGADRFVFETDNGNDIVADYNDLMDFIDLSGTVIADFTDLTTNYLSFVGSDGVITIGASSITILNYSAADLSSSNYIFA